MEWNKEICSICNNQYHTQEVEVVGDKIFCNPCIVKACNAHEELVGLLLLARSKVADQGFKNNKLIFRIDHLLAALED